MADYNFYGFFTATKTGKTGLTVTCTVYGPGGTEASAQAATEVGGGLYKYTHTDATPGDYIAVFATADTSVDAQHVPALATKQLTAYLDAQVSTLPALVWAVATSTLTVAGTIGKYLMDLIFGVWAYVSRTLTQTSAQVQAAMSGSTLTITRGDTFTASLTGLGNISTRAKLYFTVKGNKSDLDSGAIIQLEETAGLTVLNGAAYTTVTDGSIVVTDAVTGALTITLKPDVTKTLAGNGLYYDLQIVTATGVVQTITAATCNVVEDVTRAVS